MTRRSVLAVASAAFAIAGVACIDLFHKTNFETLCIQSPDDPACMQDSGAADVADVAVDAFRPHADFCAWSSAEARTQALRACAWLGACEGPLGESAFGPCVVHASIAFDCSATPSLRPQGDVDRFWGCLSTVKSCGDVDACVFPAGVQDCVAVPTGSSTACGTLAGNAGTRLKCAGPAGRAAGIEPCVMFGKACAAETSSVASCAGPLGFDKCTRSECQGTKVVDCGPAGTRKLDRGVDCAGFGAATCVDIAGTGPVCLPGTQAKPCAQNAPPKCDGATVASCISGRELRIDCTSLGLACDTSQLTTPYDPTAACVTRGASACTGSDTCTGTKLQGCGRGASFEVDCASVGLGTCKVDANGNGACARP